MTLIFNRLTPHIAISILIVTLTGCNFENEQSSALKAETSSHAISSMDITAQSTDTPIGIPDNNSTGITSGISITDNGDVAAVQIDLDISHSWRGDIRIRLQCPDGTSTTLKESGNDSGDDIRETYLVTACNGQSAAGRWNLIVSDHGPSDVGTLNSWTLRSTLQSWSEVIPSSNTPISIPDNNSAGITSIIESGNTGSVIGAQVQVDIDHTYRGDIQIKLECPSGTQTTLKTTASDSANDIHETYAVTACNGQPAAGQWKLIVSDNYAQDVGTLSFWKLSYSVEESQNQAPTASIELASLACTGDEVTLDGSSSSDPNGDAIGYVWQQLVGPSVDISDTAASSPTFRAPEVTKNTTFMFKLIVNDGQLESDPATASITVQPCNQNNPPVANAGADQTVVQGNVVTLDGSGSFDPDNDTIQYEWQQTSGPKFTLVASGTRAPSFTAPISSEPYTIGLQLMVTDGELTSAADTVLITVTGGSEWNVEIASTDTPINIPDENTTGISSSLVAPAAGTVIAAEVEYDITHTYIGDLVVTLDCPNGTRITLHNREGSSADDISEVVELTECANFEMEQGAVWTINVSDHAGFDTGSLEEWNLRLKIQSANEPPIAITSDDMTVTSNDAFELLGDRSYDPEGQLLTYTWLQVAGPTIEYSNDPASLIEAVAPEVEGNTVITFELTVNDGQLDSEPATVNITILPLITNWSDAESSADTPLDIPDAQSTGVESTIVPGIAGTLSDIQAHIDIIHPNMGNLTMDVICPNGTVIRLHDRELEGTSGLSSTYSLRACDGIVANSTDVWTLRVIDHVSGDSGGLIRGWRLNMNVYGVENHAPVAKVVYPEFSIHTTPTAMNLDATANSTDPDGDAYTCQWTQIAGPTVEIYNPGNCVTSAQIPHFAGDTNLQFELVINDGRLNSLPATMTISVDRANSKTLVFNWTDGRAIPDNNTSGVTIDAEFHEKGEIVGARLVSDIDHENIGALQLRIYNPFTNSWVMLHDRTDTGTADLKRTFDVTALYTGIAYPRVTYKINVNDNDAAIDNGYINSLRLEIDVLGASWPPNVDAGRDRKIPKGTTITLDGMGTFDKDGGDITVGLTYQWTQTAGPSVQLFDADTPYPTLVAPQVDETTVFEFELVVSDSYCSGAPDTVQVAVYDTPATCGNKICDSAEGAHNCSDCRKDVLLVVESALLSSIQDNLNEYINDLDNEGLSAEVTTFDTGTVDDLRDLLTEALDTMDISGAMLIGNLPTAWFEDLSSMVPESEFPGDAYLMDLDADYWIDADNNEKIETSDEASQAFHAEIFTSRLSGTTDDINAYFARLHQYRTGGSLIEASAYLFLDDDFAHAAHDGANQFGIDEIYSSVELMYETDLTTKDEYLDRLTGQGAEFVYQIIHSSPQSLSIQGTGGGSIRYDEIRGYNFKASFLMMNDCSAARFTEENLGMAYTAHTDFGLNIIGSTRVWYGIYDTEFQSSLAQGLGWGEAYRRWANYPRHMSVYNLGTVVTGDPVNVVSGDRTLRALRSSASVAPSLSQDELMEILKRNAEFARDLEHESFSEYRVRNPHFF